MLKIKISGVILELPKELVIQIPYFKALFNDFYEDGNKEYIDINEPALSITALMQVIDSYQGKKLTVLTEYIPTFEFLGIDYSNSKIEESAALEKELTLQEFFDTKDNDTIRDPLKLERYFKKPMLTNENITEKLLPLLDIGILNNNIAIAPIGIEGYYHPDNPPMNTDNMLPDETWTPTNNTFMTNRSNGDLIDKVYIEIKLPKLNYGTYWKNKVGLQLIKKIEFYGLGVVKCSLLNIKTSLFELEHYIDDNNDYWKIFDYPEEERKNLSCSDANTIIIPFKLCESKNYAVCLIASTYMKYHIKIELNDITELIEGPTSLDPMVFNTKVYGRYILFTEIENRRKFASNVNEINYINYRFKNINIYDSDNFVLTDNFNCDKTIPILVIIKINGEIITEKFKKVGEYYVLKIEEHLTSDIDLTIQLKDKGDYNGYIIIKIPTLLRYAGGMSGLAFNSNEN